MNVTLLRLWSAAAVVALFCLPAMAADAPKWQPLLAKSFHGELKGIRVTGLTVYRNPGCVFLQVEGKGVYCSSAGAASFKPVTETWQEVRDHAQKVGDPKHRFAVTDRGVKESTDGGKTWSKPISLPKDFVVTSQTWVEYDATNGVIYLMKKGSDLYKLARGK